MVFKSFDFSKWDFVRLSFTKPFHGKARLPPEASDREKVFSEKQRHPLAPLFPATGDFHGLSSKAPDILNPLTKALPGVQNRSFPEDEYPG
jgi:hypothetical protein